MKFWVDYDESDHCVLVEAASTAALKQDAVQSLRELYANGSYDLKRLRQRGGHTVEFARAYTKLPAGRSMPKTLLRPHPWTKLVIPAGVIEQSELEQA